MKVLFAMGSGEGWGGARSIAIDFLDAALDAGLSPHIVSFEHDGERAWVRERFDLRDRFRETFELYRELVG
jgi:hypothetical protein